MTNPNNQNLSTASPGQQQLVFFGEDWGRHPSTAQYLAGQLLDSFSVTWINSIGLREPSLSIADLGRVVGKVQRAFTKSSATESTSVTAAEETVTQPHHLLSPWVLPWHRFGSVQATNQAMFQRQIAKLAHLQAAPYSVVSANPASYYLLDTLKPTSSLYYCADKYAHIAGLNPTLVERFERELLERVDTVAATSVPLVDDLSKHHNNVHYLPHGVDFDRFNSTLNSSLENSQATDPQQTKPVVGFVGLLGEHIDFELIKASAAELNDAHFLFVGPVEQGITLPQGDNLEYLGSVDQSELPTHLRRMDICTLPYAMTERNHYANPTKVREYLAAGRACVATKQPGLMDIEGEVSIASDTAGYINALKHRLAELPESGSSELQKAREAIAVPMQNETWAARAARLQVLIGEAAS